MSYTIDGEYLIAGGKSKFICIYNVKEEVLVKRFEISQNKSFDGIDVSSLSLIFLLLIIIHRATNIDLTLKGIFGS